MKMSDVFEEMPKICDYDVYDRNGSLMYRKNSCLVLSDYEAEAALYAIKGFDVLTDLNKELLEALEGISEGSIKVEVSKQPLRYDWVDVDDYFEGLINKAKELLKEQGE